MFFADKKNYFWSYLVNVQGLHGIFDQLDVDLCLLWLKLLVRNELSLCREKTNKPRS